MTSVLNVLIGFKPRPVLAVPGLMPVAAVVTSEKAISGITPAAARFFEFMDTGYSDLACACLKGNPGIVNAIDADGETVLMRAVEVGSLKIARQALASGADVNAVAPDGFTALHLAARRGKVDLCEALLAGGADVNRQTACGITPLSLARSEKFPACAKVLIDWGARAE